jgi:hypothetical protein
VDQSSVVSEQLKADSSIPRIGSPALWSGAGLTGLAGAEGRINLECAIVSWVIPIYYEYQEQGFIIPGHCHTPVISGT